VLAPVDAAKGAGDHVARRPLERVLVRLGERKVRRQPARRLAAAAARRAAARHHRVDGERARVQHRDRDPLVVGHEAAGEELEDGALEVLLEHQVLQLEVALARVVEPQHPAEAAGRKLERARRLVVEVGDGEAARAELLLRARRGRPELAGLEEGHRARSCAAREE